VSSVAGSAQHSILAPNLSWEQNAVAVVRQKGVLHLIEGLEVKGVAHPDGRTVIAVAPSDVVAVFKPKDARVIAILKPCDFRVIANPLNGVRVNLPVDAVFAEPRMQIHDAPLVVNPKDARVTVFERHNGAVEDAVCSGDGIARDNRVFAVTPDDIAATLWSLLPRERHLLHLLSHNSNPLSFR